MADRLSEEKCAPCEGGTQPLGHDEAGQMLAQIDAAWELADDGRAIRREFKFKNFLRTMSFVNAVAWVANAEDHHPDMEVGYNRCLVQFSTHAIGGLSRNDFICAARIDALHS